MSPRLLALAASALVLPLLAAPADAATPRGPATPSLAQVAAIYPELVGGETRVDRGDVPGMGADCEDGDPIAGARSAFAEYDVSDPAADASLDRFVTVLAGAVSFRSARDAATYLEDFRDAAASCFPAGPRAQVERIRFHVGQERFGLTMAMRVQGHRMATQVLMARTGRVLVLAVASGIDEAAPTVRQGVRLTDLALRTAR